MPVLDGWEATRQLKTDPLTKDIIIIAVTAHAFPAEHEAARVAGCDFIIAKPFDLGGLANGLNRVISEGLDAFDAQAVTVRPTSRKHNGRGPDRVEKSDVASRTGTAARVRMKST